MVNRMPYCRVSIIKTTTSVAVRKILQGCTQVIVEKQGVIGSVFEEATCRHPISGQLDVDVTENSYDEKPMNKSWIFEIGISEKGLIVCFESLILVLRT